MDPEEIEFVGENEEIGVIPNFNFDPIHLISGTIGPFRAGIPLHIPLWIAIHLRKQQKCRIVTPEWMEVEFLEDLKEEEKRTNGFLKMPSPHYMIIAKLVMGAAMEDITNSEQIKTLIKDLFDMRTSKLRKLIDAILGGDEANSKLDNITMLELHSVRPFVTHAMDLISRLERTTMQNNRENDSSTRGTSSYYNRLN